MTSEFGLKLAPKLSPKLSKEEILQAAGSTIRRIHTIKKEKRASLTVMPLLLLSAVIYLLYPTPDKQHLTPRKGGVLAGGKVLAPPHPNPGQVTRDTLPSFPYLYSPPAAKISSASTITKGENSPLPPFVKGEFKNLPQPLFTKEGNKREIVNQPEQLNVELKPAGVEISWAYDGKVYDLQRCSSPKFDNCEAAVRVAGNLYIDNEGDSVYPIVYYRVRKVL